MECEKLYVIFKMIALAGVRVKPGTNSIVNVINDYGIMRLFSACLKSSITRNDGALSGLESVDRLQRISNALYTKRWTLAIDELETLTRWR